MKGTLCSLAVACALLPSVLNDVAEAADLTKEKVCYGVAYAHLDDQWLWTLKESVENHIPRTLHDKFAYLQQYPEYVSNFEKESL